MCISCYLTSDLEFLFIFTKNNAELHNKINLSNFRTRNTTFVFNKRVDQLCQQF